ncbi:hypothetical protein Tco_1495900 [Tanacetum coccineum]
MTQLARPFPPALFHLITTIDVSMFGHEIMEMDRWVFVEVCRGVWMSELTALANSFEDVMCHFRASGSFTIVCLPAPVIDTNNADIILHAFVGCMAFQNSLDAEHDDCVDQSTSKTDLVMEVCIFTLTRCGIAASHHLEKIVPMYNGAIHMAGKRNNMLFRGDQRRTDVLYNAITYIDVS